MTTPILTNGVSHELAQWRARNYRDVRYHLCLTLTLEATHLQGTIEISVTLARPVDIVLDWRAASTNPHLNQVEAISINDEHSANWRVEADHIFISQVQLKTGANVIKIAFTSPINPAGNALTRYHDGATDSNYVYTLFVPCDASTAFPCLDQPDLKACFTLEIVAPAAWHVVSNSKPEFVSDEIIEARSNKRWCFEATAPISTYLFAFAAGEFAEFHDAASPLETRLYVRRSQAARIAEEHVAEVLRLSREACAFFAEYTDCAFPFSKYDLVILPEFPYGGMEHAGATFLREEAVIFPTAATRSDIFARAELIAHEAAHQWFGDLVTMRWFDDLWLKEGFATLMSYKAIEVILPSLADATWKYFYLRAKTLAYQTDATDGTTALHQIIPNLADAKSAYGNIVYRKAPSVLRSLEMLLGSETFRRGVQLYLTRHAYEAADWHDLVLAFEDASGRTLERWADDWIHRRGMPRVRVEVNDENASFIRITQDDALDKGAPWMMRFDVLVATLGEVDSIVPVIAEASTHTIDIKQPASPAAFIFANHGDYGYGRFLLDAASQRFLHEHLDAVSDDFRRALLWGALWDSVVEGECAPVDFINTVMRFLPREEDEITIQIVLQWTTIAFNRFLDEGGQRGISSLLETFMRGQITHTTHALRLIYLRALLAIAITDDSRLFLKGLVSDQAPTIELQSRDSFAVIAALFALDDEDGARLLETQTARDGSDEAKRYAFAACAARMDAKQTYFAAYIEDAPRIPESWIEASLTWFNSPRHAHLTLEFLPLALERLPHFKRTRKIFFINNWLASFIGNQTSDKALTVIDDFLERLAIDIDLERKILEASDLLRRSLKVKAKLINSPYAGHDFQPDSSSFPRSGI
ncbi:MAG: M1 family aminopeptidase [Pyrinomonadaceae bacterium MAG19_C2-C3]|nr:M1 family aminopeptidase [Pyrinomonadaceae bacterium MAG19_C2-C3]